MNKKENIRKREIQNLVLMIIITAIIGLLTLFAYFAKGKEHYIKYNENSQIDYKVYLKENDFYDKNYLEKGKGYIASLIDSISTNFTYNIKFSEEISYKYSYRIAVEVDVQDGKNDSNIYHFTENLVEHNLSSNTGNLDINEDIVIKYENYNNIISRFKEIYDLSNTDCTLNAYLYVNIQDIDKSNTTSLVDKKVSSLAIPLTLNTVSIDIGNNIITNNHNQFELSKAENNEWILAVSAIFLMISAVYVIILVRYIEKTKTAQMVYEKEIKSILSNYDSYIQKINGTYDIGTSQVLKIETFNDMLEIRDTLKQPILMLENEAKDGSFFIIPATNSIIYTYALRVVDIKAKMDGKEIPTYDITEIAHSDFMKRKKYTDEYIKDQITMTSSMPTVDERNVIKGSKDKNTNLYDQLEKTTSFDLREIRKAKKEMDKKKK